MSDKATVPLCFDTCGNKLGVAVGDISERIAKKYKELSTEEHRCETAARAKQYLPVYMNG